MHDHKEDHVHSLYNIDCKHERNQEVSPVHIQKTEGAIAASFSVDIADGKDMEKVIGDEMQELARWVNDKGGIIGHIKSRITESEPTVFLSITSDVLQRKTAAEKRTAIGFAAIVFNVNQEELQIMMTEIYRRLFEAQTVKG